MDDNDVRDALVLALRALTEGIEDIPDTMRSRKCAKIRVEAKRAIRRVLKQLDAENTFAPHAMDKNINKLERIKTAKARRKVPGRTPDSHQLFAGEPTPGR